jgi:hypothetical protein
MANTISFPTHCAVCGGEFRNIGHMLRPGVIIQRPCNCLYEAVPIPPGQSVILTKEQTEQLLRNSAQADPRDEQIRALREELAEARAGWKRTALELDGYEGGVPQMGTRLWRAEKELGKARDNAVDLRVALSDLVGALPKCIQCGAPAPTRDGTMYYCEAHEPSWIGGQHELPYAAPLQRCLTLLKGGG